MTFFRDGFPKQEWSPRHATVKLNEELLDQSSPSFEVKNVMDGKGNFYQRLLSDANIKQQLGGNNIPEPIGCIKSNQKKLLAA